VSIADLTTGKTTTTAVGHAPRKIVVQAAGPAAADGTKVSIANFQFVPAVVTIAAEASVIWSNDDGAPHAVAFTDDSAPGRRHSLPARRLVGCSSGRGPTSTFARSPVHDRPHRRAVGRFGGCGAPVVLRASRVLDALRRTPGIGGCGPTISRAGRPCWRLRTPRRWRARFMDACATLVPPVAVPERRTLGFAKGFLARDPGGHSFRVVKP
jgi:plastocyanin